MNRTEISFIIPVYNGAACIKKMLSSILRERDICFEVIVVDDGSTDETGRLCDELADREPRLSVYHTKNQGQGKARNYGMKKAQGKYLFFADADDKVEWSGIRILLKKAEAGKCDLVCGSYKRIDSRGEEEVGKDLPEGYLGKKGSRDEISRYHKVKTSSLFGYVWNKLYRREFLDENGLFFDDVRRIYMEDTLFNLKVFCKDPVYYLCPVCVYQYDVTGASTTRRPDTKIAEKSVRTLSFYSRFLREEGKEDENRELFVPLAMRMFCWALVRNIPHEGISLKRLKGRVRVFLKEPSFFKMMRDKNSFAALSSLPVWEERFFYSSCLWMLGGKIRQEILAVMFLLAYPVMKLYIKSRVK